MYRIIEKQDLTPTIKLMKVVAPAIARKAEAGQFVILRLHDHAEADPPDRRRLRSETRARSPSSSRSSASQRRNWPP